METGTVTSKGQITIPKKIRDFLNIETSEKLVFTPIEDGKVLVTKEQRSGSSIFGMLKHRKKERIVSLDQMENEIQKRRLQRAAK